MRVKTSAELSTKEIIDSPDYQTIDSRGSPSQRSQWEPETEEANERKVVRKFDCHILPILCAAFFYSSWTRAS
jgi:hypothetical protein